MKSKRRHELQHNDLATILERWWKKVEPFRMPVLIAAVVLLGGGLVYKITSAMRRQTQGEVWRSFFSAASQRDLVSLTKQLKQVAQTHQETEAGLWAALLAGDVQLSQGFSQLFSDRALATTSLNDAKDQYEYVLKHVDQASKDRLLKLRALYGLGQAHEALSHIDDAVKQYEQVVELAGDRVIGQDAKKRLELLKDKQTKQWYTWFARQEPRPPVSAEPKRELPGSLPGLDSLPDEPDLTPPAGPSTAPATPDASAPAPKTEPKPEEPKPEKPKAEAPKAEAPKPAAPKREEPKP